MTQAFDFRTPTPPLELWPSLVEAKSVEPLSDAELDQLPFGVICLDGSGWIRRYNLAEANFARLDRATVLGKHFFRKIAPCTATLEFEGRFREFTARPPNDPGMETFRYVFDFQFGAQEVTIEMVRGNVADRYYLCVNRVQFLATRDSLPPGFAAPTQGELEDVEQLLPAGVLRDERQQRIIHVSPAFFSSLYTTWLKVSPRGWRIFGREWGLQWGRAAVVDLETHVLEQREKTLRELAMREALEFCRNWVEKQGWGALTPDFSPADVGAFLLRLERGALAEAIGPVGYRSCTLLEGFFCALFSHLAHKLLCVREVQCQCAGHEACVFVVVAENRREQLEAALEAEASSVETILATFVSPSRAGRGSLT